MPTVSPVSEALVPLTGPWQVVCGPVSALYHQFPVQLAMLSVADVPVFVRLSDTGLESATESISFRQARVPSRR